MAKSHLTGSSDYLRELKAYEEKLFKQLQKSMNTELSPIINPIENKINSSVTGEVRSLMPGMFHDGRTQWGGVTVTARVSVRPRDLVFIEGKGRGSGSLDGAVGFEYAELAGIERKKQATRVLSKGWGSSSTGYHSYIKNGQGAAFNSRLTAKFGKPGRFLFRRVLRRKPEIEAKVKKVADQFGIKLFAKFNDPNG